MISLLEKVEVVSTVNKGTKIAAVGHHYDAN